MKTIILVSFFLACTGFMLHSNQAENLAGAWEVREGQITTTAIFTPGHYAVTRYDLEGKKFIDTRGGSWRVDGKNVVLTEEFNTADKEQVGKESKNPFTLKGSKLTVSLFHNDTKPKEWARLDAGEPGKLAGAWLITGRMVGDGMQKMTPGARRTMKILSGTRFQWIAYNVETKEFSGTGGGTYRTENGKYTEHIQFFSRDNSRVGQSLEFDFSLEDGNWRHKGLSSKGDPIDEVWTKRERLGI